MNNGEKFTTYKYFARDLEINTGWIEPKLKNILHKNDQIIISIANMVLKFAVLRYQI